MDAAGDDDGDRLAAESGDPAAMGRLGDLSRDRGDLDAARQWYLRAAEAGDVDALCSLGGMAKDAGDLEAAVAFYERAAEGGNRYGHYHLGFLAMDGQDPTAAEALFRRAAEEGLTPAMEMLGYLLEQREALDEALSWHERAAEAGSEYSAKAVVSLRARIVSEAMLDSLGFETFGWEASPRVSGVRQWHSGDGTLMERYFDFAPDFDTWDAEVMREDVKAMQGLVDSPEFRREDLPESFQPYLPAELPEQVSLLGLDLFEVSSAKCVAMTTRHRAHGHVHYAAGIMVLFAECFWLVGIELEEGPVVGEREGAVARAVLDEGPSGSGLLPSFDPYETRWDGIVPLEDDPLARLRILLARLRASITLGDAMADLPPFVPPQE